MVRKLKNIKKNKVRAIENLPRSWWCGNKRVDKYMSKVYDAITKEGLEGQARINIYNRAYEAVHEAICDYDKL